MVEYPPQKSIGDGQVRSNLAPMKAPVGEIPVEDIKQPVLPKSKQDAKAGSGFEIRD